MVCHECGFNNKEGAAVCASCGSRLNSSERSRISSKHQHHDGDGDDPQSQGIAGLNEFEDTQPHNPFEDFNEFGQQTDAVHPSLKPAEDGVDAAQASHPVPWASVKPSAPYPSSVAARNAFANAAYGVNSQNLADLVSPGHPKDADASRQVDDQNAASQMRGESPEGAVSDVGHPDSRKPPSSTAAQVHSSIEPAQGLSRFQHPTGVQSIETQTPQAGLGSANRNRLLAIVGIVVATVIAVCLILIVIAQHGLLSGDTSRRSSTVGISQSKTNSSHASDTVFNAKKLNGIIAGFSDVDAAVAGKDINGSDAYASKLSKTKFVAAGLYLPIYLDAHSGKNPDSISASDIMMNTMSNDDANTAMADLGGADTVTQWLHQNGYPSSEIGRNFGDVAASNKGLENYSTAADSVAMLVATEKTGGMNLMTYDVTADGVKVPDGMQVAAHRGQGIKNAYNYFMIVKEKGHTIALAILTRNQSEDSVTSLTSKVLASIDSTIAK
ncbi:MAG: serine hydrolase [Bifidobacterium sp.]|uniref:hypothetical protein n=1 Tax=Bifidobacterium sp. TaxID=41200 RepID=UPI0039E9A773